MSTAPRDRAILVKIDPRQFPAPTPPLVRTAIWSANPPQFVAHPPASPWTWEGLFALGWMELPA